MLKRSDVVFMYNSTEEAYTACNATFVAWGNSHTRAEVERHHRLGVRCTANMWCLTAGAKLLHENPSLLTTSVMRYDAPPVQAVITKTVDRATLTVPELNIWTIISVE